MKTEREINLTLAERYDSITIGTKGGIVDFAKNSTKLYVYINGGDEHVKEMLVELYVKANNQKFTDVFQLHFDKKPESVKLLFLTKMYDLDLLEVQPVESWPR